MNIETITPQTEQLSILVAAMVLTSARSQVFCIASIWTNNIVR